MGILNSKYREYLVNNFIEFVKINTESSENTKTNPSTKNQFELAYLLKEKLESLGLEDVEVSEYCYVYAKLRSNCNSKFKIAFLAHMDTSPAVSGENVVPKIIENYDGEDIILNDSSIKITSKDSKILKKYKNRTIITASGKTLLGADDKAGIAEILTGLKILKENPDIKHPEIRIIFTPDEEIGEGTLKIDKTKLGDFGYTFDGGEEGSIEDECFDAYSIKISFKGLNVHPGEAKGKMINALRLLTKYLSKIPERETPEKTDKKNGFYHLTHIKGDESFSSCSLIIRDFNERKNKKRIKKLEKMKKIFENKYKGLIIDIEIKKQYRNMKEILSKYPEVVDIAIKAIKMAGLKPIKRGIRGGTDGARLTFEGMPTPNIFTGGILYHSIKEWISVESMEYAVLTFINICKLWSEK
ncbi:MAG: peptidase T [Spirochaetes bacterium]|nr:peptidase T [Spirochaetota bacterium]